MRFSRLKVAFIIARRLCFSLSYLIHAQVSINNAGTPPDSSSMPDVSSTTKGWLIPGMTKAKRDAIVSPATGFPKLVSGGH